MNIKDILIDEESSMLEAMELLDQAAKKVLFVVKNDDFVAAITDGDIRRWILKKGRLDAKVKEIANYNPKYLYEQDKGSAIEFMKSKSIEALPILDKNKEIISVVLLNDEKIELKKDFDVPIVIMAGGFGTRLYPYTKILPKALIPIGEIPIVEHIINRFTRLGSSNFLLVVNHKKNMIKSYFNDIEKNYEVSYIEENQPLGTGGGLSLLKGKLDSAFVLTNCDILIEENYSKIYEHHKKEKNLITMVTSLKKIKVPYGVIDVNQNGEIGQMKEKPELSFLVNTGMYIVEPEIIDKLEKNHKIGFPDIIEKYRQEGEKIGIYPISENSWLDMGQLEEMDEMRRRLGRENG